ncbi:MAG TPA: hypothetical protein DDY49_14140 [Paenibacillaceae bacterium]|nr:hypothetical protein [Paenibacillaceae bacterium]
MSRSFKVKFRDGKTLIISDIIKFEERQQEEIKAIAVDYTKANLCKYEEEGIDLSYLSEIQKETILNKKNRIVSGKTPDELQKKKIITMSLHSLKQMYERIGSNELTVILSLIDRIIHSDFVLKAQFKGYPTLSYTLMEKNDPDKFKFPVFFSRKIKNQNY